MKSQEEQWLLAEKYGGVKSEAFYADCKALALGTPLGYLIGHVPFLDCMIHLDEQPLIPRVETEFWVEQAIATIKEGQNIQPSLSQKPTDPSQAEPQLSLSSFGWGTQGVKESVRSHLASARLSAGGFGWGAEGVPESGVTDLTTIRILDLCAGSGCIGVAVAKHIPAAHVDFAELSQRLLPTIKKNCEANDIDSGRYAIYHSNLLHNIPEDTKYDFILSNPPYIDPTLDRATDSVKTYEPHLALYGGVSGMEIIEQLITAAPVHLLPGGQLWIEHEPEQAAAINDLARTHGFTATNHPDQYDVIRYSILVRDLDPKESGV